MAHIIFAWAVPPWVLKALMTLLVLAGIGALAAAVKILSSPPEDAFTLATGYKELDALKGKHPTAMQVSELLDRLDLNAEQLQILKDGFEAELKSSATETLQTIVIELDKRLKSLSEEQE